MPPSAVYDVTGPSSLLRLNNQLFIPSQFPRSSHAEVHLPASRHDRNVNRRFQLDFGCQFKKIYRSMILHLDQHSKPATFFNFTSIIILKYYIAEVSSSQKRSISQNFTKINAYSFAVVVRKMVIINLTLFVERNGSNRPYWFFLSKSQKTRRLHMLMF